MDERGHLVAGVWQDDLIVRVAPDETAAVLREKGVKPFMAGKSTTKSTGMKG